MILAIPSLLVVSPKQHHSLLSRANLAFIGRLVTSLSPFGRGGGVNIKDINNDRERHLNGNDADT